MRNYIDIVENAQSGRVMYHGSPVANLTVLKPDTIASNGNHWGKGVYLTPHRELARTYALMKGRSGVIYSVIVPHDALMLTPNLPLLDHENAISEMFIPEIERDGALWEMSLSCKRNGRRVMSYIGAKKFKTEEEALAAAAAYTGLDLAREIDVYTLHHTFGIDGLVYYDAAIESDNWVMYGPQTVHDMEIVSEGG